MKLYQATIECANSCYVETVLVVANDMEQADEVLCVNQKRKVTYKKKLKELQIDMTKPSVIEHVGFGENESDFHSLED
jgi:hypothetical protein